jgi:hypothetical protein
MWTSLQPPGEIASDPFNVWVEGQFHDLERVLQKVGKREPFQPVWSAATTAPVLGNGSLIGAYVEVGSLLIYSVRLVPGTTTTFGTGAWAFTVPRVRVQAEPMFLGSAWAIDSSAGISYPGICRSSTVLNSAIIHATFVGGDAAVAVPFAWANGDTLVATIAYPLE